MKEIWDKPEVLDKFELMRNEKKDRSKRITFDCFNLKCRGDRAICSKGKMLGSSKDGSMSLFTVLRGTSSGACLECKDYDA